ncbi:MAG: hypothetical protein A2W35_07865 [Chloroflexi bacterium RBG_16_57_11]|nr:MAG: hypothetical protein A2W35_07865 [Chloroflexi bacterium RBG_16_57_11]
MPKRRTAVPPEYLASLINLRVIGGAFVVASCMLLTLLGLLWATRSASPAGIQSTAVMNLIPAETMAAPGRESPGSTGLTQTVPPSPPPGVIAVGAYVQIKGTAGSGLRFREQPGLEAPVLLLGAEAEVFQVKEGPQDADGYVWWYLVGPYDPARHGWAVANYLEVVQNP